MNKDFMKVNYRGMDDSDKAMYTQAEIVKQLLQLCSIQPGATITITVHHNHGHKAIAELYDHAALVQSLHDTLEYFQSELV